MKPGTILIIEERAKQIKKGFKPELDAKVHKTGELSEAAAQLIICEPDEFPDTFDREYAGKICALPYPQRLVIAGALIAAELDRLNGVDSPEQESIVNKRLKETFAEKAKLPFVNRYVNGPEKKEGSNPFAVAFMARQIELWMARVIYVCAAVLGWTWYGFWPVLIITLFMWANNLILNNNRKYAN